MKELTTVIRVCGEVWHVPRGFGRAYSAAAQRHAAADLREELIGLLRLIGYAATPEQLAVWDLRRRVEAVVYAAIEHARASDHAYPVNAQGVSDHMKCRVYETTCINDRFCRAREACCAGDMSCVPLSVDALSDALDEVCKIAFEWIDLGIPDDGAQQAKFRVQSLLALGTARRCTCREGEETPCEVHHG